jgi:hypothetical protein
MRTTDTGWYTDVGEPLPRPADGPFYLEAFRADSTTDAAFRNRTLPSGVELNLLISRVGLVGPPPGGFALFSLRLLSQVEEMARSAPAGVSAIGLYETAGREVL